MKDNVGCDLLGNPLPQTYGKVNILKDKPSWPGRLTVLPSDKVVDYVLKHAGARPKDRDDVDKRIISDFINRKSRFINRQDEVGGHPKVKMVYRSLNVPDKNIDKWLEGFSKSLE